MRTPPPLLLLLPMLACAPSGPIYDPCAPPDGGPTRDDGGQVHCPCGRVYLQESPYWNGFEPTCLPTCTTTSDCPPGLRCLVLWGLPNTVVCASDSVPRPIVPLAPFEHCDIAPDGCM